MEGKCNMHLSEIWHSKKNDSRLSRTQVFSELEGTFGKLEGTSVGVEIVSIEQDGISRNQATADSGVEVAWAGSCLLIRARVTIGTSPRIK